MGLCRDGLSVEPHVDITGTAARAALELVSFSSSARHTEARVQLPLLCNLFTRAWFEYLDEASTLHYHKHAHRSLFWLTRLQMMINEPLEKAAHNFFFLCLLRTVDELIIISTVGLGTRKTRYPNSILSRFPLWLYDFIFFVGYFRDDLETLHLPPVFSFSVSTIYHPPIRVHNLHLLSEKDTKAACSQPACLCWG